MTIAASWGLRLAVRLTAAVLLTGLVLEMIVKILFGHSFNSVLDIGAIVGGASIAVVGVSGRVAVFICRAIVAIVCGRVAVVCVIVGGRAVIIVSYIVGIVHIGVSARVAGIVHIISIGPVAHVVCVANIIVIVHIAGI